MDCASCGKEVETVRGAAFEITGWEQAREQGGTNHVLWRERTDRVMCAACVTSKKYGSPIPGQLALT